MSTTNTLQSLTDAQRQAVQHVDGPLLILAGPGSGKTRVITHRVAHLLAQGIGPHQILALTFTNKAADEMRLRLERLAPNQPVWMGTFHRFCARMLRRHAAHVGLSENFTIYDTDDSRRAIKRTVEALGRELVDYTPDRIAHTISWAKNKLIRPDQYEPRPGHPLGSIVAAVYPAYQKRLLASNAVDFDDLLMHVAVMLRENPELRARLDDRFRYILVDEYQDTNLAQYAIVRALSIDHQNLAVTGDPDQSIYGWRGANLNNILNFEHDYPDVRIVRLEENYRSTKCILHVAGQLITHNKKRKRKSLFTANRQGSPVRLVAYATHKDEAAAVASQIAEDVRGGRRRPRDFAVFYRINALSRAFEFALRDQTIPFQIVNGVEFYQRREIKDVLGYLHLLNNPRDDVAFQRVINSPPRGIGKTTIARLTEHAGRYNLSMLEAARESGLIESLNKRAALMVAKFVAIVDNLSAVVTEPVEEVLGHVLNSSGYQRHLLKSDSSEDHERLANIEELLTAAREFDEQNPGDGHLEQFLELSSLVNDTDAIDGGNDTVTLMTLHAAKGLEFPVVFIIALEEGLLPHELSRENDERLEEERRLLFVGITRAEEELRISRAEFREFRGRQGRTVPSSFIEELPREDMDVVEPVGRYEPEPWEFEERSAAAARRRSAAAQPRSVAPAEQPAPLKTAADMLAGSSASPAGAPPEAFHQGMVVTHPNYGLGRIVALSGSGEKRTATISFASGAGQKKFRIAQSPLQPAKKK